MVTLKNHLKRIRTVYRLRPWLVVPTVTIAVLISFILLECLRARLYLSETADFKRSVAVLTLRDQIDVLTRQSNKEKQAFYCELNLTNLLARFNPAYSQQRSEELSAESLNTEIGRLLDEVGSTPAFNSLLTFLPGPKEARAESERLAQSLRSIRRLTADSTLSRYCLALRDSVFSRVYFISELQKPESVSALLPGQIENFQKNTDQALESLAEISYPANFETQHTDLYRALVVLRSNIASDEMSLQEFARQLENDYKALASIAQSIELNTSELQRRPSELSIAAASLKE